MRRRPAGGPRRAVTRGTGFERETNAPSRRLAWFTPLPPVRSGISAYSAEVLPWLTERFEIDVYVDDDTMPGAGTASPGEPAPAAIRSAHDFLWRHRARPYDLVVYQLGNATCHDYMWAYLTRIPGLVVLHDGQLHHARARQLLTHQRTGDYRDEFVYCHPQADPRVADLAVAGFAGPAYYLWSLLRVVLDSARLVAVHSRGLADDLRRQAPDTRIAHLRMGVPDLPHEPWPPTDPTGPAPGSPSGHGHDRPADGDRSVRARHGIPPDAVVFGAFGVVTPEKRVPHALDALPTVLRAVPDARLLLVGEPMPHFDARAEIRSRGLEDHVVVTGFVPDDQLPAYIRATDVCLCMRWPSSRETSASWLRCLAAGKPTVITDLVHTVDVPAQDPRTWEVLHAAVHPGSASPRDGGAPAVCVSLDILDEDHSLRLAMRRLAKDADLRAELGDTPVPTGSGATGWSRWLTTTSASSRRLSRNHRPLSTDCPRTSTSTARGWSGSYSTRWAPRWTCSRPTTAPGSGRRPLDTR